METAMILISYVPERLLGKAAKMIELFRLGLRRQWRKLEVGFYSFNLSKGYRILTDGTGHFFVGKHEAYELQIRKLQRAVH